MDVAFLRSARSLMWVRHTRKMVKSYFKRYISTNWIDQSTLNVCTFTSNIMEMNQCKKPTIKIKTNGKSKIKQTHGNDPS